ncbi:MAG: HD domain-containing protein [Pseudonocardiaceae bacterium]
MVIEAHELARAKLAFELPQRWRHVEAAANEAQRIAPAFGADATVLVTATWLHDIGYAPELIRTGFHPLDGANFLQADGWLPRIVDLVATHSGGALEALARGLRTEYAGFADEASPTRDALWYCDVVAGPNGQPVDEDARLAELTAQYGSGELATRSAAKARDELANAIRRTRQRLKTARL